MQDSVGENVAEFSLCVVNKWLDYTFYAKFLVKDLNLPPWISHQDFEQADTGDLRLALNVAHPPPHLHKS